MVLAEEQAKTDGHYSVNDEGELITVPSEQEPQKTGRILCISGFADSSRDMANRVGKDVEVWGLNRCYTYLKRWDVWFEVHDPELYTGQTGLREADYLNRLKQAGKPIYMQHPDPDLPTAQQLPVKEMIEHFGRDYFTTSIAYMVAFAVYQHDQGDTIQELKIFGVDMSAFSEYSYQRPCVEYWLGVAAGRGIKITEPMVSPILKAVASYGRHTERLLWAQAQERLSSLKSTIAQQSSNLQATIGAGNEYNHVADPIKLFPDEFAAESIEGMSKAALAEALGKVHEAAQKASEEMKNRFQELQKAVPQLQADLNASMGAGRECQHWLTAFGAPQREQDEPDTVKLPR